MTDVLADPLAPLRRFLAVITADKGPDLTAQQMFILAHLATRPVPSPSVKDLGEALNTNKPGISRSLDRLEFTWGFVQRTQVPEDRRRVSIVLTEAGDAYVAALAAALAGGAAG